MRSAVVLPLLRHGEALKVLWRLRRYGVKLRVSTGDARSLFISLAYLALARHHLTWNRGTRSTSLSLSLSLPLPLFPSLYSPGQQISERMLSGTARQAQHYHRMPVCFFPSCCNSGGWVLGSHGSAWRISAQGTTPHSLVQPPAPHSFACVIGIAATICAAKKT